VEEQTSRWWQRTDAGTSATPAWSAPEFDDTGWKTLRLPGTWEDAGFGSFRGITWLRREFDLSAGGAAQAHRLLLGEIGTTDAVWINGKLIGTYGDAATFSFYPGKNLGALGDAGCLITNNDQLADWCEIYARHGGKGDHQIEGINSRLDGLQAAVLNVKLPHLSNWTALRQKHAGRYDELLGGIAQVKRPVVREGMEHVYHLYVIRTPRRDALKKHLAGNGVATVLNYPKALPFYPAYAYLGHKPEDFPVAFKNQHEILSLPIFPEMTDEQIGYVVEQIGSFFKG
jgi:dTDP-4-amino-4,6-dideoxygalactose transaminase